MQMVYRGIWIFLILQQQEIPLKKRGGSDGMTVSMASTGGTTHGGG
jgi:hypothetical protein